jgi:hypothetical protein
MEQGLKDLKKMLKEKAKKFGEYSPANHISCETALMMIDRIETLEGELKWAWDNLAQDLTYPQEGNEYDYCVDCDGKWGKHKKNCKLVEHKEVAKSLGIF